MPTVLHSTLTGSNNHEPKGAGTAAVDEVYVADGAGSGSFKLMQTKGWENIDHAGASQALSSGVRTKVLNDAAGAQTFTYAQLPAATGSIWDASTNSFNFVAADLKVGDTVDLRIDIDYTVNSNNDGMILELDLGVGSATTATLILDERNIDMSGTQRAVTFLSFFIGNNDILTSPADMYVTSDSSSDSIDVSGWYVRLNPLNPRFS